MLDVRDRLDFVLGKFPAAKGHIFVDTFSLSFTLRLDVLNLK